MDYAELKANVFTWLNKPEVESSIPVFIALCEATLSRALGEAGVTGAAGQSTAAVNSEFGITPSDMALPLSMTMSTGESVKLVSPSSIDLMAAERIGESGRPTVFTVIGEQFRYSPIPDQIYTVTLRYQRKLAALSDVVTSNWLLTSHPDAYLYGTLLQAAPFLGDDQRVSIWSSLFESALSALVRAERSKQGSQDTPGFRTDVPARRDTFSVSAGR